MLFSDEVLQILHRGLEVSFLTQIHWAPEASAKDKEVLATKSDMQKVELATQAQIVEHLQ